MIRLVKESDIDVILRLFLNYIDNSFFVKLDRALLRLLLTELVHSSYGMNFVYTVDSRITAFISSTSNCPALLRNIFLRRGLNLSFLVLRSIFKTPAITEGLWRYFLYAYRTMVDSTKAELLFIAIEPDCRLKGVATQLIRQSLTELNRRGIQKVRVAADQSNTAVNRLLQKLGFELTSSFRLPGREMYMYTSKL